MSWSDSPSVRARITTAASSGETLPKGAGRGAAGDASGQEPPGPRVRVPVQPRQVPVVQRFAPELDEHGPEVAALQRDPETRAQQRPKPAAGIAGTAGLRRHATVEVGDDAGGGAREDRALVAKIVMEDPGAHARLGRDPLHRERGVAVAREAADCRPDDRRAALGGDSGAGGLTRRGV